MANKLSVRINKYFGQGAWDRLSKAAKHEYAKLGSHGVWRLWKKNELPDLTKMKDAEPVAEPVKPCDGCDNPMCMAPVPALPTAEQETVAEDKPKGSFIGRLFKGRK